MDYNVEKENSEKDDLLLERIKSDFKISSEAYAETRKQAAEDFRMKAGKQWDDDDFNNRVNSGKPAMVMNKLNAHLQYVVNQFKMKMPGLNVIPSSSDASSFTAKVLRACINRIEKQSNADAAYVTCFSNSATGGEGFMRVVTRYPNEETFNQEIYIESIDNPFSVFVDPNIKNDFSNYEYAFIFNEIPKTEYKRLYPKSKISEGTCFDTDYIFKSEIIDNVKIAEYYYIKYTKKKVYLLDDGSTVNDKELDEIKAVVPDVKIVKERMAEIKSVEWIKTNGFEILEKATLPIKRIPVIPNFGNTYLENGRRVTEGLIRHARDAQKHLNMQMTLVMENLLLSPKVPYIGVKGQFAGFEGKWNTANRVNHAFLEYNAITVGTGDQVAPPPQRSVFDPQISTLMQSIQIANDDIKAITGIQDPALGIQERDTSGKAILTNQKQSEVINYMYIDSFNRSLKYLGDVLIELIPKIYDTEKLIRIQGDVNTPDEIVTINQFNEMTGEVLNKLDLGEYDVEVSIDPYGMNNREKAADMLLELSKVKPELIDMFGDILMSKLDFDGATVLSNRFKKAFPQFQETPNELPEEAQVQIAQMQQEHEAQMQQLTQQLMVLQDLNGKLESELNRTATDLVNREEELRSKERIALNKNKTELLKTIIKEDAIDSREMFNREVDMLDNQLVNLGEGVNVPDIGDQYIITGMNDMITRNENEASQEGGLDESEMNDLLTKLDNHTEYSTKMDRRS